ncbi:hypothetical protein MMC22_008847 [Lobaria immixta]|nr:hypothetical protein [Lobaria immixta]
MDQTTMLRLAPTQITLGSRDLTWHTERHNNRRDREDQHASRSIEITRSLVKGPQSVEQPLAILPYLSPPPLPGNEPVTTDDSDTALISKQPVLRGSQVFWGNFLAEAGASTGVQVQTVERRPRITEMPRDSQGTIRSSKGSIEEDLPGSIGPYHDATGISHPQNPSNEPEKTLELQSRFSSESDTSFEEYDSKDELLVGNNSPEGLRQFNLPIRSSSMSSYGGRFLRTTSQEDPAIHSPRSSGHAGLDGYSESVPAHHDHQRKRALTTSVESEHNAAPFFAQTPRRATGPFSDTKSPPENPRSPQLPPPRSVDNFRLRSNSSLPRSPLCISQVPESSSPEKRPRPKADSSPENSSSETVAEPSGMLAEPPRRRKKYKALNQGYIYDETALESAQVYGIDRLSIQDPLQSSLPTTLHSSRTEPGSGRQQVPSQPQNTLFSSSPASSRRNTSPYSIPSLSTPRNNLSSPTLPPHPFSATPRTVSFSLPLSPTSPSALNPSVPSFSPSRVPRRMAVYNDNLPALSQPQTPARLPLNGLPAMSLQNPFGIGIGVAQTAPAGIGRRRRDSVRPTTPTRRGRAIEDQENLGVEVEAGRRRVRESASREWEWEWDWDGDDEQDEDLEAWEGGSA